MNEISVLNQNPDVGANKTAREQATDKKNTEEKKRLKKACADFESLMVYNMLKTMRNTIPQNGLTKSNPGKDTFNMLMDRQIADDVAKSHNGLGLQKVLYDQLTKTPPSRLPR
jgi:peptidoglycan hydrolase FlgJ